MANLGVNYKDAGRVAEAIPLLEEAYRSSKKIPTLRWVGQPLLDAYGKAGQPAEAIALHEKTRDGYKAQLPADHPKVIMLIVNAAILQSRMIATAYDPKKQADLAMATLRQAVAGGYNSVAYLKREKNLDPLRERVDFKKLIAELEKKAEKK